MTGEVGILFSDAFMEVEREYVTIPFDYDPVATPASVIPICVARRDDFGETIAWGWFEALVPIADKVRGLSRRVLLDVWRSSELAEGSVHDMWYEHGPDVGPFASAQLYHQAKWMAQDMKHGGWRRRRGVELPLPEAPHAFDRLIGKEASPAAGRIFHDHFEFVARYEHTELMAAIQRTLKLRGDERTLEILDMVLHECPRKEIAAHFRQKPNTITQRMWRGVDKALKDLGLR